MKAVIRLLYQVHRWVGVVLALFMFLWFFTGVVIIYATPTTQTRSQQLTHAETLSPQVGWLSLGEAWTLSEEQRKATVKEKPKAADSKLAENQEVSIAEARLVRSAGVPLWLVEDSQGKRFAISALDGSLQKTTVQQAITIAQNWYQAEDDKSIILAKHLGIVETPIILRNQDALKPFHHIGLDDGRELLISERTGEVLHASTQVERAFFWAGNWLHLLKPLDLISKGDLRHNVQLYLGLFATLATLTGLIIGWLRWRPGFNGKSTYSEGRTQPYREFWFKWHFWSGLIGGSVALFWAFSGFLDTNPGKIFSQANPAKPEINRYLGKDFPDIMRRWQPNLPLALATGVDGSDVVELTWRHLGRDAVVLANTRDGQRLTQVLDTGKNAFDEKTLLAAVSRVAGKTPIASQKLVQNYDSYYYPRHHQNQVDKPLPVLLVTLADDSGTRFYVDPQDGKLLAKLDRSARAFRWFYSALHHWDFGWLYWRPVWDLWMLTWVAFGIVLGFSSVIMGYRLLKKTFLPKKQGGQQQRPGKRYVSEGRLKTVTNSRIPPKIAAMATYLAKRTQ